ncbi:MAG: transporter ATP-binding protein [Candidatus Eremiobacteraeota bacterium]|nr:transporter ATP-binding protein [Candidatus Eremiobacteraeota bacterium]
MLQCTDLQVRFGNGVQALRGVTLRFDAGITGLVGRNGSGKSTLMKVIATSITPNGGSLAWNGEDAVRRPDVIRGVLGYVPQYFGVYQNLTAIEFLEYLAALRRIAPKAARARALELLDRLGLASAAKRRLGGFSGGMLRRVGIAAAFLGDPQLIVLDEPSVGLDQYERANFVALLEQYRDRTIVLGTHIFSDLAQTADALVFMDQGSVADSVTGLRAGAGVRRGEPVEAMCERFVMSGSPT